MDPEAKNLVTLTITFDPDTGEVQANGPLNDEMLVYFMLEKTKQIEESHIRRATAPLISRAPLTFPKNLKDLKN